MAYDYSELVEQSKNWAQRALTAGWLDEDSVSDVLQLDCRTPQSLLAITDERPLIVAFMGGTGVGKSSLLNRLAEENIAKSGIERPTSHEITIYYHESLNLERLQLQLPLEKIKTAKHTKEVNQNIIWIDMPDFDSTEITNKELVLQCLPYIDVLIYVVSPERYRDNKAWELLLAEGQKHAWLFVLNQWDLGQFEQYDDFKKQLAKAGFNNPLVFRSSCTEQIDDEFSSLLENIRTLATTHSIEQLQQHNLKIRKQQLRQQLQQCLLLLGKETDFKTLIEAEFQKRWQGLESLLAEAFIWSMRQYANQYAEKDGQLLARKNAVCLWDEWAQNRFDDLLDELILNADRLNLPTIPLRESLQPIRLKAAKLVEQQVELGCRQALANPGNLIHRIFLKISRFCEIVLPLTAMSFVAYQLLLGFYQGAQDKQDYLGVDFAIHSVLLIGISWLLPYFIHKKMQPSIEKAALNGLKKGFYAACFNIESEIMQMLSEIQNQQQKLTGELNTYIEHCVVDNIHPTENENILNRVLSKK